MRIGYQVSIDRKLQVRSVDSPYPYRHTDGRTTEIRGESTTYINEYERGTLVIDIVDAARDELVWRGVGERLLRKEPTAEQMEQGIRQGVSLILGLFPPGGSD